MKKAKRFFQSRAHAQPLSMHNIYFPSNNNIDWTEFYKNGQAPKYLDIGCGFGSFLFSLSKYENNSLGLEIRKKVTEYVKVNNTHDNIAVINTNSLITLPNLIKESSLEKIFINFPDPQFKKRKRQYRIMQESTLRLYLYLLQDGGYLYFLTDVEEYFREVEELLKRCNLVVEDDNFPIETDEMRTKEKYYRLAIRK